MIVPDFLVIRKQLEEVLGLDLVAILKEKKELGRFEKLNRIKLCAVPGTVSWNPRDYVLESRGLYPGIPVTVCRDSSNPGDLLWEDSRQLILTRLSFNHSTRISGTRDTISMKNC